MPHFFYLKKENIQADKNKVEIKFPKFGFPHFDRFRVDFDHYYKEKFGGKNEFVKLYNFIQYHLLQSSPLPESVVLGKDGWLFLGNRFNNIIYSHIGIDTLTKSDLESTWRSIQNRQEYLKQRNIKYYVCIAPNKHTVYDKYLPTHFQNRNTTKLEQLKSYLKMKDFELIDLKDNFYQYDTFRLFHKTNTHWNHVGAFLGYKRLISSIQVDFDDLESFELNDFRIDTLIKQRQDITKMMKIDIEEKQILLNPKEKFKSFELENQLTIPDNFNRRPSFYENRFKGTGNLKVLMFRDSFSTAMICFLKEYFGEIVFVWRDDFNTEIIEKEKPDIVIHEIVERNINSLNKGF